MPLALHLPSGHPDENASPANRLRLWLAAQQNEYRRVQRFLSDRRRLLELDDRLLGDVGLTREDVLRDVPFRYGAQDVHGSGR